MPLIVAWTGHRPDLFRDPAAAKASVDSVAHELVQHDAATRFLVGGQRGVDTWAALAAESLGVPFTLFLPLPLAKFTEDWSAEDRAVLERTLGSADAVHIVGGDPARAFSKRNRLLATTANMLVAVWAGIGGGGTAETLAFARAAGVPVRELVLEPDPQADSRRGRGI